MQATFSFLLKSCYSILLSEFIISPFSQYISYVINIWNGESFYMCLLACAAWIWILPNRGRGCVQTEYWSLPVGVRCWSTGVKRNRIRNFETPRDTDRSCETTRRGLQSPVSTSTTSTGSIAGWQRTSTILWVLENAFPETLNTRENW